MAKSKKQADSTSSNTSSKQKFAKLDFKGHLSVIITSDEKTVSLKNYIHKLITTTSVFELIWVGASLDAQEVTEIEQLLGDQCQFSVSNSTKEAIGLVKGSHVLVVDDLMVSPRQLITWMDEETTPPSDEIWTASYYNPKTQLSDGYRISLWARLLSLLTRVFTGIVPRDVQTGFCLYPTNLAKALYANVTAKDKNQVIEVFHLAKLYDIDVVEKEVALAGTVPAVSIVDALTVSLGAWLRSWSTWLKHYFVTPAKDAKADYFADKESPWFRFAFAIVAVLLFILMPYLSPDYGLTADEYVQNEYGNMLVDYYETNGKNFEALFYKDLYNYGGLFDYWAAWGNKYLAWFEDPYDMRHLLNSVFGAFMMLFIGLVGRAAIGTWMGALFAILFAALSPRLFGHSMNNPKDIPFAAAYIFTIYHALRFTQQLPKPTIRTGLALALGIAAAINIRVGGLLLIAYLAAFSGITFLWKAELRKQLFNIPLMIKMLGIGGVIALLGFWFGSVYWPYAALDWMNNPFKVLSKMSHYYVGIRVLFNSTSFWSDTVPWNYIPYWMYYTTPLFVIIGFFASPIFAFLLRKERRSLSIFLVAFAGLFPICYVIYQKSGLYDAMRHMLFAYTLFPVLAAWTWYASVKLLKHSALKTMVVAALITLMSFPLMYMVRNHPYQYIYFNELIGGNNGAYKKYETDYWMVSMKPLSEWFDKNIAAKDRNDTLVVATNCIYPVQHYLANKNIKVQYIRYHERESIAWDYGIFYSRFIDREFLINNIWPPSDSLVHAEKVDDVPIGVLVKRKSSSSAEAGVAFSKRDWATARPLLEEMVKNDPNNESAYILLAQLYSQIGEWPEMKAALDRLMELSTDYSNTWGMLGIYHLNKDEDEEAIIAFEKATEINYKYTFGNYHLARLYREEGRLDEAIERLILFDTYGGLPEQGYDLAIEIAEETKNDMYRYFFMAKKKAIVDKNWGEAMKLLDNCFAITPNFEPAIKMKLNYDDAVEKQILKNTLTEAAKQK